VCLGWYVGIVLVFLWWVSQQSDAAPQDCDDSYCISDRGGWSLVAFAIGAPIMFASMFISFLVLALLDAKARIGSVTVLGSVTASPALIPVCWVLTAMLR
jgi:hypothetical protein